MGGPEIGKQTAAKKEITKLFLYHKVNLNSTLGGIQENCFSVCFNFSCVSNEKETQVVNATAQNMHTKHHKFLVLYL